MNSFIIISVLACILILGAAAYEFYNQIIRKEKEFMTHVDSLTTHMNNRLDYLSKTIETLKKDTDRFKEEVKRTKQKKQE